MAALPDRRVRSSVCWIARCAGRPRLPLRAAGASLPRRYTARLDNRRGWTGRPGDRGRAGRLAGCNGVLGHPRAAGIAWVHSPCHDRYGPEHPGPELHLSPLTGQRSPLSRSDAACSRHLMQERECRESCCGPKVPPDKCRPHCRCVVPTRSGCGHDARGPATGRGHRGRCERMDHRDGAGQAGLAGRRRGRRVRH